MTFELDSEPNSHLPPPRITDRERELAARRVTAAAGSEEEARVLLRMLGLLEDAQP